MDRTQAVRALRELIGRDLCALARELGVTRWKVSDDKKKALNKGWAGHVIERYLGRPLNSVQQPDFGDWELKVVPLHYRNGVLRAKETMAITMIHPDHVARTPFANSHLFSKLQHMVVVARIFESKAEEHTVVASLATFDLSDQSLLSQVQADYELVQLTIRARGFQALTGRMGVLVQPRTKGPGHGSTSRAFYARKEFLERILGL